MGMLKFCEISVGNANWFLAEKGNILCQEINGIVICKAVLPNPGKKIELYNAIYEFHGKLFLVPYCAERILVFDIKSLNYYFLDNEELSHWMNCDFKYAVSYRQGNCLYLFGRRIPYIVKIDMDADKIILLSHLVGEKDKTLKEIKVKWGVYFANNYSVDENIIWIPLMGEGILAYHLENDLMQLYEFETGYCAICRAGKQTFWLYSAGKNNIVKWNPEIGIFERIEQINLHSEVGEAVLEYQNNVLKCKSQIEIVCINVQTGQRMVAKRQKKEELFLYDKWEEEAAYQYLNEENEQIFAERKYNYLGNPASVFVKYIKKKNREDNLEKDYFKRSIGSNIYYYVKDIMR